MTKPATKPARWSARGLGEDREGRKVRMVTEARRTFGNPAAAELWVKLGLPVVPAMRRSQRPAQGELFP